MNVVGWIKVHRLKTLLLVLAALLLAELATVPWGSVASLAKENPTETALMMQREKEASARGKRYAVSQHWIPLSKLPPYVADVIVVAEDGMFYAHNGFDWFEVGESLKKDVAQRRFARGGSTITQQVAKNLYLSTSKDPLRKAKEALLTLLLEHHLTKDRILEVYLNIIEWGDGVFGIDAASRTFFHKSASALTIDDALRLAAVIPSPLRHRPDRDSPYVMRRKDIMYRRYVARQGGDSTTTLEDSSSVLPDRLPDADTTHADSTDNEGPDHGL